MENCYDNKEMDKVWNEEDYLEIAERQHERLSQKDIEYTDLLCWILEQFNEKNDIMIIHGKEYDRFMKSDNEDDAMDMQIVKSKDFHTEFKKISGIDIMNESNFVSMKYIGSNDINLIIGTNGDKQRYVIGI